MYKLRAIVEIRVREMVKLRVMGDLYIKLSCGCNLGYGYDGKDGVVYEDECDGEAECDGKAE